MGRPPIGKTAMTAAERQRRHRAGLTTAELPPEPADVTKIRQAALTHLYKMRDAEGKYGRERTWTGRELLRLRKRIEAKGWPLVEILRHASEGPSALAQTVREDHRVCRE